MVDERLVSYIQNMLHQGYTREAIRSQLIRYGYAASDVDEALGSSGSRKNVLALIFAVIVVIAAFFLFFIFRSGDIAPEKVQLTITIQPETETVGIGGVLSFSLTIESDDLSVTYGRVTYRVADSAGGVVVSKEERVSLLQPTIRDSLSLPHSIKAADYSLIAEVSVNGEEFLGTAAFEVVESDSVFVGERVGPPSAEEGKRINDIVSLSEEDASGARSLCLEFANQQAVDQCLLEAGLSTNNELFCPDIRNPDKRDTCYFNIMLIAGKRELCGSITNQNLRSTCTQI